MSWVVLHALPNSLILPDNSDIEYNILNMLGFAKGSRDENSG
jgi:hypothetical protein